jgi:hypothetical protein
MEGPMSDQHHLHSARAQVRMRLAFWTAQDRRGITEGPAWLWRGALTAPRRDTDLPTSTAAKIRRRRAAAMPAHQLYLSAGPRRTRLPRWVSLTRAALAALVGAAAAALGFLVAPDSPRIAALAFAAAVGLGCAALTIAALDVWARRDPLRLSAAERADLAAGQRAITWNPLQGAGPVSGGAAFALEALEVCGEIRDHPAWAIPAAEPLRWQFDPDEEVFQIARAACALDRHTAAAAAAGADPMYRQSCSQLSEALLDRLVAMHRFRDSLTDLCDAHNARPADTDLAAVAAAQSTVESEMATAAWTDLNADLIAHVDGYAVLAEAKPASR